MGRNNGEEKQLFSGCDGACRKQIGKKEKDIYLFYATPVGPIAVLGSWRTHANTAFITGERDFVISRSLIQGMLPPALLQRIATDGRRIASDMERQAIIPLAATSAVPNGAFLASGVAICLD